MLTVRGGWFSSGVVLSVSHILRVRFFVSTRANLQTSWNPSNLSPMSHGHDLSLWHRIQFNKILMCIDINLEWDHRSVHVCAAYTIGESEIYSVTCLILELWVTVRWRACRSLQEAVWWAHLRSHRCIHSSYRPRISR